MKLKIHFILAVAFVFATTALAAQSIASKKIEWLSDRSKEMHSDVVIIRYCTITTDKSASIELRYENNELFVFSITQIEGTWNDPQQAGSILYHVLYQNRPGTILIERLPEGSVTILIDFTQSGQDALKQKFSVVSFKES